MKIRIKDIAQKAGVSPATVSRAINPETRSKVAPATLKKIDRIIAQYHYVPNLAAKSLRKSATKTIGVIFPGFTGIFNNSYYTRMISGLSDFILGTEYNFKILLLKENTQKWRNYDFRSAEGVDGLIVTHAPQFFPPERLADMDIPCALIDDLGDDSHSFYVCGDHFNGGQQAARYLYGLGHKQIAVFTGVDWSTDSQFRLQGFQSYLRQEVGIVIDSSKIIRGDYREDVAYQKAEQLIKIHPEITAIFCCNDEMALGAIRRLQELGISCPQDISVVGYDDNDRAVNFIPPLTTIRAPMYKMAQEAAKKLTGYLQAEGEIDPLQGHILFPVELIERSSAGSPRKRSL